jgi:hypothetical protein
MACENAPRHEAGARRGRASNRLLSSGLWAAPANRDGLTVGSGIRPDLLTLRRAAEALAGSSHAVKPGPTAGGEFRPALKTSCLSAGKPAAEV